MVSLLLTHPLSGRLQFGMKELMGKRDTRVAKVVEVIDRIKAIQLSGWEKVVGMSVDESRSAEVDVMASLAQLQGAIYAIMAAVPDLMTSAAFAVTLMRGGNLSGDLIFSSLGFFSLINMALSALPGTLAQFLACQTSFDRIHKFLLHPDPGFAEQKAGIDDNEEPRLLVHRADFGLGSVSLISSVELDISRPALVTISGAMGMGKSTLLKGLTGSAQPLTGHVITHGRREYMPQTPFIVRGTLKDNILFGRPFHADWYHHTLKACALDSDLKAFPHGDLTDLSDAGIALSGGQKSRICLARVVYSRADLYFFDDPLAALDSSVRRHIIDHIFGQRGLLKNSIRIVVTSDAPLIEAAQSRYAIRSQRLIMTSSRAPPLPEASSTLAFDEVKASMTASVSVEEVESPRYYNDSISDEETPTQESSPESAGEGQVDWSTYLTWLRLARPIGWVAVLLLTVLGKLSNVVSNYNLELLSLAGRSDKWLYIALVAGSGLMQGLFGWGFIWISYHLCLLPAARGIHARLVRGVLGAPLSFYTRTPSGQILNRFTNDISKVDGTLASNLIGGIMMGSNLLMVLGVLLHTSVLAVAYLLPFTALFWILQARYLSAVRDLKRLEIESRSPIIMSIQEAINGYNSILVSGQWGHFLRQHYDSVNENIQASIPLYCLEYWLSLRLEFLSGLIIAFTASLLLWLEIDSAELGFVMTYAMQISIMLTNIIRFRTNLEIDMISVERIKQYLLDDDDEHPSRDEHTIGSIPYEWPRHGVVRFNNFSAGYDSATQILKNISLEVGSGEKVAVVGRTGAGKSSLALCLTRMIEAQSGYIAIDGVDISQVNVHELRRHVTMIPQEPAVFTGTLRYNLDPEGRYGDLRLLDVVRQAGLPAALNCEDLLLEYEITDGGKNLSSGQSQLLAIARVLLSDAKIIVMDEASAALDAEIDQQLQRVLREAFSDRTVFTITHKAGGYMSYNRVLALGSGRVISFDTPMEFLKSA
ncbi:hypothetical protein ABOM_003345 [Aspergillus bombycis]|uniref:ABC multidrug transporter n=1 Tax=Aspergillus bombycis TaxID=109264 RepID=A0A1F8A936_9EURO|nr:hypothetical protein ABOM_003345 [Aspergillus bombycis]OGM47808.1 hypothetical protein ABOM_003345 [Aspergillus bombycis]